VLDTYAVFVCARMNTLILKHQHSTSCVLTSINHAMYKNITEALRNNIVQS